MISVFGDMGSRVTAEFQNRQQIKSQEFVDWAVTDMSAKIDENRDGLTMILCEIKNSIKDPDNEDTILSLIGIGPCSR